MDFVSLMEDQAEPSTGDMEPPAEENDPKDYSEHTQTLTAEEQQLEEYQQQLGTAEFEDYCRAYGLIDAAIIPAQEPYPWDREINTFLDTIVPVPDPVPSPPRVPIQLAPDPPDLPQFTSVGPYLEIPGSELDEYLMMLPQENETSDPDLGGPPPQDANQPSQIVSQNTVELIDLSGKQPPSGPSKGPLKRPEQNPNYIDSSFASSMFNESPAAKRVKTPTHNSPSSLSRRPSAAPSTSQTPQTTPQITRPPSPMPTEEAPLSSNATVGTELFDILQGVELPEPSGSSSPTQVFALDTFQEHLVPVRNFGHVRDTTAGISSLRSRPQAWRMEGATIILGEDSQNLLPDIANETNRTHNSNQPPYDPLLPDVYDLPTLAESSSRNQLDIPSTSRAPAQPLEVNAAVGSQNQETNAETSVMNNPQRLPLPTNWRDAIEQGQLICLGGPRVDWAKDLHPRQVAACFTVYAQEDLELAWELARKGVKEEEQASCDSVVNTSEISSWTPRMFANIETKAYVRYFPAVIGTRNKCVLGFDLNHYFRTQHLTTSDLPKDWVSLPNLKFYPLSFDRVIAGSAGLLVVDGGEQPIRKPTGGAMRNIGWEWQQAYKDYWILEDYRQSRGQSMLVVINPLTLEARLLPPMPQKILKEKVGSFNFYDAARVQYRLLVVGVHEVPLTDMDRAAHLGTSKLRQRTEICLAVYCSKRNEWVHFDTIPDACPAIPRLGGRSGIAVMNHGVYYGGHKVVPQRDKVRDIQTPALFYFNTSNYLRQQLTFTFDIARQFGLKVIEPPKLVRAGPDKIYALTRESKVGSKEPRCLFITEVILNSDGSPTGSYKAVENGMMPPQMFDRIFRTASHTGNITETKSPAPMWDVVASEGLLAIKVTKWDLDLALFHMETSQWIMTSFPCLRNDVRRGNHREWEFIEGTYEPVWLAIP